MSKITRVEVIERGVDRHYVNPEVNGAWIDIQDEGRTLKVFINEDRFLGWLIENKDKINSLDEER